MSGDLTSKTIAIPERELWSLVRSILEQGRDIQVAYAYGVYSSYEHCSARVDEAARERADKLLQKYGTAVEPPEVRPTAWMRGHRNYRPGEPDDYDVECVYGDEPPDGSGKWVPLYRSPTEPPKESHPWDGKRVYIIPVMEQKGREIEVERVLRNAEITFWVHSPAVTKNECEGVATAKAGGPTIGSSATDGGVQIPAPCPTVEPCDVCGSADCEGCLKGLMPAHETSASRGIHPNCTPPCPICDE